MVSDVRTLMYALYCYNCAYMSYSSHVSEASLHQPQGDSDLSSLRDMKLAENLVQYFEIIFDDF